MKSRLKPFHLEGVNEGQTGLDIEAELDREHRVVTLHMLEFDAALIESFLEDGGLRELGVRVDDSTFGDVLTLPLYRLVIDLAGRHHPASLQYLRTGRISVRLGDPNAEYLARCRRAIELVLSRLHTAGIEAVILGIDRYGRPAPTDGHLELYAFLNDGQAGKVARVAAEVEAETRVRIATMCDAVHRDELATVMRHERCWAWAPDVRQVVPLRVDIVLGLEPESPAFLEQLPADAPLPTRVTLPRAPGD